MNRRGLLACVGVACAALGAAGAGGSVRLVYNASDSLPRGWYRVERHCVPHVGSAVLVRLPAVAAALAAQRGYLPAGVPVLKRVAAVAGQRVCTDGASLRIDGVPMGVVLAVDGRGRSLPAWRQCRDLSVGELFLLGTAHPASFDSRYFGPVEVAAVIGCAHPLGIGPVRW